MTKQLARKSSLSFLNHILYVIFGFISLFFVKRYMGYEAVGMIAFATSFIILFNIIGDMGFGIAHLKRVGEGLDLGRCHGTIITIKLFLTFVMGIVVFSWLLIQKYIFHYKFESKTLEFILCIIIIQHLIMNISMAFNNIFSAKLEIARGQTPRIIGRFLVMLIKVSVAFIGLSVIYLAYAELLGAIVILLLFITFFKGYPIKKPNKEYLKIYATFAIPMIFVGFVATLSQSIDKVMLGYFIGSLEVGIYTVPQRITQSLLLISSVITSILFVTFSELYTKKNIGEIQRLSNRAEKYISTIIFPFVIFVLIFAKPILLVFGSDTGPSIPILQIMVVTIYITAIIYPYSAQVISTGHIKLGFKIGLLILGMNLFLNTIFIPDKIAGISFLGFGAKGAALATLISFIIRGILYKIFAYKITKTRPNKRILIHFFAAIVTFAPMYLMYSHLHFEWIYLFGYFPLTVGLFLGIMRLFGEFTKKDFEFYWNAINPKKMGKYVKDELKSKNG